MDTTNTPRFTDGQILWIQFLQRMMPTQGFSQVSREDSYYLFRHTLFNDLYVEFYVGDSQVFARMHKDELQPVHEQRFHVLFHTTEFIDMELIDMLRDMFKEL